MRSSLKIEDVTALLASCDQHAVALVIQALGGRVRNTPDLKAALAMLNQLRQWQADKDRPFSSPLMWNELRRRLQIVKQLCTLLGGWKGLEEMLDEIEGKPKPVPPPPPPVDQKFVEKLAQLVDNLEMSVRVANCLASADIRYTFELAQKTETEMIKIKNFHHKSLKQVKELLAFLDLTLGMRFDEATLAAVRAEIARKEKPTGT